MGQQFEFLLGEQHLPQDDFLKRRIRSREDRFVPIQAFLTYCQLSVLSQNCRRIVAVLQTSPRLEVQGEAEEAMVRALEDYSVSPDEGPDRLAAQQRALSCVDSHDYLGAVRTLKSKYYEKHIGPMSCNSPSVGDILGIEHFRCRELVVGIEWVLSYYMRGCSSWSWYYP